MTEEELKAAQAQLKADQDALSTEQASFTEQQDAAKAAAETARVATIHARVDGLVKSGKVLPADAGGIKSFAEGLASEATLEFGEGDDAKKLSPLEYYLNGLETGKTSVDFKEHSAAGGEEFARDTSAEDLAKQGMDYRESESKAGRDISITQAVNHIQREQAK